MEELLRYENEIAIWYENKNKKMHNIDDKPAYISKICNGAAIWYKNGLRHRTKGPAIIDVKYQEYWWYEGEYITDRVNQLMEEGRISSDWENWTEEDEFLFILLIS